jgi:hypothetical protein
LLGTALERQRLLIPLTNPDAWPTWLRILVAICLGILDICPWILVPRKLTRHERVLAAIFFAAALSVTIVFLSSHALTSVERSVQFCLLFRVQPLSLVIVPSCC